MVNHADTKAQTTIIPQDGQKVSVSPLMDSKACDCDRDADKNRDFDAFKMRQIDADRLKWQIPLISIKQRLRITRRNAAKR